MVLSLFYQNIIISLQYYYISRKKILSKQTKLISRSITIIINNNIIDLLYSLKQTKSKVILIQSYQINNHPTTQDKLYQLLWYNDNDDDDVSSISKHKHSIEYAFLKTLTCCTTHSIYLLHPITFIISHINLSLLLENIFVVN